MPDNEVDIKIVAQTGQLTSGLKTAGNDFKSFADAITQNADKISLAFKAIAVGKLVQELTALEQHFGRVAEEIDRVAQMTGLTTKEVQQFTDIVEVSGGSVEGGVANLTKLERSMAEAAHGTGDTALAFKALNISVLDSRGHMRSAQAVLGDLADKFSKSENGAVKTAYAMQFLGRGGAQLIPVLNKGKDGLAEFNKEFEKTQSQMSESQISKFGKLDDKFDMLGKSFQGLKLAAATYFEPLATLIVDVINVIVQAITKGINKINEWTETLSHIGYGKYNVPEEKQEKKENLKSAPTEKSIADARKLSDAKYNHERENTLQEIALQEAKNQSLLDSGEISNQKFLEMQRANLKKKEKIDEEYYAQKLAAAKGDEAEQEKIRTEYVKASGATAVALEQNASKSRQESMAGFKHMYDSLTSGMESMTEKLIRGTATFKDAFKSMCADLIVEFAKMQVKNVAAALWAAGMKKAATLSELATVVWASGVKMAIEIKDAIFTRAAAAMKAAANTYASTTLIPIVGPFLAPVAAAAAFAGVMAFVLPSAAGGWDEVPRDGLAMIHKKEMVLPAPLAEKVRNMSGEGMGGGAVNYNINIHAVDSKSFGDMIKRNPNFIVDALHNQTRNFNANSPGWRTA